MEAREIELLVRKEMKARQARRKDEEMLNEFVLAKRQRQNELTAAIKYDKILLIRNHPKWRSAQIVLEGPEDMPVTEIRELANVVWAVLCFKPSGITSSDVLNVIETLNQKVIGGFYDRMARVWAKFTVADCDEDIQKIS